MCGRSAANLACATCWRAASARRDRACASPASLIDAATGAHLWADRFDGTLEDIFDLQDQVTASVVAAIQPNLRQGRDPAGAAEADREPAGL